MFRIIISFHSIWLYYMNQFPGNWTGRVGKFDCGLESSSGCYRVFLPVERAAQVWYIKIYIYTHRVEYTYKYVFQFMCVWGCVSVCVPWLFKGKCWGSEYYIKYDSTIALNTSMLFGLWFCLCIWFSILVSVSCVFLFFCFVFCIFVLLNKFAIC